jgi:hypothetical protein
MDMDKIPKNIGEVLNENKLDYLLNHANIGTYNKCEIIEIFGFNKEKKEAFNIYTLVTFENTIQAGTKELLTEKLQPFKGHKNLSWGIQRRVVDIDLVLHLYLQLLENNQFEIDQPLSIGKVQLLDEQYVPPREDMHREIQLNNILKNNFNNGAYILEFFDEDKNNIQFLLDNQPLLNQFSEEISSILPIKIGTVSDRLGNIVFQFPINNFELYHDSIRVENQQRIPKYQGIKLEIISKSEIFYIQNLVARLYEEDTDKLITRQRLMNIDNTVTDIAFNDCFGTHIEIIDETTSLLLYKYKFSIMKQMHSNVNVLESQNRIFEIDSSIHKVQVSTDASRSRNSSISFLFRTNRAKTNT